MVAIEDARFYEHSGVDFQGIGRAAVAGHPQPERRPGRLDDHRAVRQERARRPGQPHRLPEVPRGGARLPARAPLEQGQDPHRVPEHDLLRRGRLRDRGRRAHLLRRRPPRLRHRGRALRLGAASPGRRRLLAGIISSPSAYDPKVYPENALARRNLVLEKMYEQGYITEEQYEEGTEQALPGRRSDIEPPPLDSKAPYFTVLAAPAAGRPLRRRRGLLRRAEGQVDARPELQQRRRRSGQLVPRRPRPDRLGRRDRQPQRRASRRWSAAPTSTAARSTWRPTGHRQPGSSIKPFTLVTALEQGHLAGHGLRIRAAGVPLRARSEQERRDEGSQRALRRQQLRRHLPRLGVARDRRPPTPTTRSTPSSGQVGLRASPRPATIARDGARPSAIKYSIARSSTKPGDDPRRPQGRRHAARDGPTPTRRSPTTATGSAAPWPPTGPATARSPTPGRPTRTRAAVPINGQRRQRHGRQAGDRPGASPQTAKTILDTVVTSGTGTHAQIGDADSGARPARPRTTATPGSVGATKTSPPASGSATPTRRRRWRPSTAARRSTAAPSRR